MTPSDERWERRRQRWEARRQRRAMYGGSGHLVLGGMVVLLGVVFLLQNLGFFYVDRIWDLWPVLLIAMGVSKAVSGPSVRRRAFGAFFIAVGLVFLANSLGYLPFDVWRLLWPVVLIAWGLLMLLRGFGRRDGTGINPFHDAGTSTANRLNETAVFGGIQRRVESQQFEGGEVTAVFGGVEVDLTQANTTKDEMFLEANAIFGGVELRIPDGWDATVQGTAILGGHEDKTRPRVVEGVKRPRLVIEGNAIFGGVSIRN